MGAIGRHQGEKAGGARLKGWDVDSHFWNAYFRHTIDQRTVWTMNIQPGNIPERLVSLMIVVRCVPDKPPGVIHGE
ncbi:MAG: hypothetical protein ACD_10C00856G0002 [uncultured bacterium]|nr:MAG: hypothetical protein ACD_10C00856G0002 [uncultured bacterium]